MMGRTLEMALGYAGAGLRVIPVRPRSKVPAIRSWPDRATTEAARIRSWFAGPGHSDRNVGIACGGGIFVLDADDRHGGRESLRGLLDGRELPPTATAKTPGGGEHHYFRSGTGVAKVQALMPGIDVQGEGSYVLAEPSVHPKTGREYVFTRLPWSGIAPAPGWLMERIEGRCGRPRAGVRPSRTLSATELGRPGCVDVLLVEMIGRFPVEGPGGRNDAMVRLVASLLGRGFDDATIVAVGRSWWEHFHRLGLARTHPRRAGREILSSIVSMRSSPRFREAVGIPHRERCAGIELSPAQVGLLGAGVADLGSLQVDHCKGIGTDGPGVMCPPSSGPDRSPPPGAPPSLPPGITTPAHAHNSTGVTLNGVRLSDRLCVSAGERAFVEAVLVQAIHCLGADPCGPIRFTRDQIREIAADRNPGLGWDNRQFERLKAKYIGRPGRPARRYELLREISKGSRGIGEDGEVARRPSEYLATGLVVLLAAGG